MKSKSLLNKNELKVIYSVVSPISGNIEVIDGIHGLELHINGCTQSIKMVKNRRVNYWEESVKLLDVPPKGKVLLLGLGGGEIIRNLLNKYPDLHITVVELDPLIIDIYNKFFKEAAHNPKIINADAYDYVLNLQDTFDLFYDDVHFQLGFPKKFLNNEFLKKASSSLNSEGIYVCNRIIASFFPSKQIKEITNILQLYFKEVSCKRVSENMLNYLFFGSNRV